MMTKQLLAILLLLPLSVSAGEVDGKAIICLEKYGYAWEANSPATGNLYVGWMFRNGYAISQELSARPSKGSEMAISSPSRSRGYYTASPFFIEWDDTYRLDRQTLTLVANYPWTDKPKVTQCEVFSSIAEYQLAFDGIRRKENEALKAFVGKNKI